MTLNIHVKCQSMNMQTRFSVGLVSLEKLLTTNLQYSWSPVFDADFVFADLTFKVIADQKIQGGNSQNFLGKFVRFFLTLTCFNGVVFHRK